MNIEVPRYKWIQGVKHNDKLYIQYYFILFQYIPKWNPFVGKFVLQNGNNCKFQVQIFVIIIFR